MFEFNTIKHSDMTTVVCDHAQSPQYTGSFSDALTTHPEHVGNELLGHRQLIARQTIQR
jgi:hypothetical protein